MKGNQIKSEFKIHNNILFLDKNVDNRLGGKNLLSLGYDFQIDSSTGNIL